MLISFLCFVQEKSHGDLTSNSVSPLIIRCLIFLLHPSVTTFQPLTGDVNNNISLQCHTAASEQSVFRVNVLKAGKMGRCKDLRVSQSIRTYQKWSKERRQVSGSWVHKDHWCAQGAKGSVGSHHAAQKYRRYTLTARVNCPPFNTI